MSEDNSDMQNQTPIEIQNETHDQIETCETTQNKNQTQVQEENNNEEQAQTENKNANSTENQDDNDIDTVFDQTQSKAEIPPSQSAPKPSLKDLQRQIAVLTVRIEDANQHLMTREDNLRKSISSLTTQNTLLRTHLKSLDHLIKKLSLLHSQLTAAPNYKLAKADVDEMIRLVSNL